MPMKTFFTLCIALSFCTGFAQLNYSRILKPVPGAPYQPNFLQVKLLETEHSFLLTSEEYAYVTTHIYYAYLTKTDFMLNHTWSYKVNVSNPANHYRKLHPLTTGKLSNGNYFMFGTAQDTLPDEFDSSGAPPPTEYPGFFFIVTDPAGNLVWSKVYNDTINPLGYDYFGYETIPGVNRVDIGIGKSGSFTWFAIDNLGNLLSHVRYNTPFATAGKLATDSHAQVYLCNGGSGHTYIQKLTAAGSVVWSKEFTTTGLGDARTPYVAANGDVYIGGEAVGYFLIKLDSNAVYQWGKSYYNSITPSLNYFTKDVTGDAAGGVYLLSDSVMLKVTANGNLLGVKDFYISSLPDYDRAAADTFCISYQSENAYNTITMFDPAFTNSCFVPVNNFALNDSSYLFTSANWNPVNFSNIYEEPFMISLDPLVVQFVAASHCVGLGDDELEEENSSGIYVYPNPANDVVKVRIPWEKKCTGIVLYDARGNRLNAYKQTGEETAIDLSNYARGLYFVSVEMEGRTEVFRISNF